GAGRESTATYVGRCGDITEVTVAIIVIQRIVWIAGNKQILVAIVVVIADSYTDLVSPAGNARAFTDILKGSVRLLVIEAAPVFRSSFLRHSVRRHGIEQASTVDEKYIEAAVVVAVEQRHSRCNRFEQVLLLSR